MGDSTSLIEPSALGMLWAVGLMVIAIGLASWQRLGLAKTLTIATFRTVTQLLFVGSVLTVIFASNQPLVVLGLLVAMTTIAAVVARGRIDRDLPRLLKWVWLAIFTSGLVIMMYVSLLIIQFDPWYDPRYLIPLTGIVLGNAMTAASIAGERLVTALKNNRVEIETHLSLGATPTQAIAAYRQAAIKAGLIPTVNAMMVVGLVTLPGVITGQLLGGASPLVAAVYQILIMFMLALATLIASLIVSYGITRQFFNSAMQLVEPQS